MSVNHCFNFWLSDTALPSYQYNVGLSVKMSIKFKCLTFSLYLMQPELQLHDSPLFYIMLVFLLLPCKIQRNSLKRKNKIKNLGKGTKLYTKTHHIESQNLKIVCGTPPPHTPSPSAPSAPQSSSLRPLEIGPPKNVDLSPPMLHVISCSDIHTVIMEQMADDSHNVINTTKWCKWFYIEKYFIFLSVLYAFKNFECEFSCFTRVANCRNDFHAHTFICCRDYRAYGATFLPPRF